MRTLFEHYSRLAPRKKWMVALLVLAVALTWLGVCAILASYLV